MFPGRIGRVALDGVVDPKEFVSGLQRDSQTFMDDIWATFFLYCNAAGADLCSIYTGYTPTDIYQRVEDSFLKLNSTYAASQNWANATILEEALEFVRDVLLDTVYTPISSFPLIPEFVLDMEAFLKNATDEAFDAWENDYFNSLTASYNLSNLPTVIDFPTVPAVIYEIAIWADDDGGASYNLTLEQLKPWMDELENQSVIGGLNLALSRIWKSVWPIKGVTRYAGMLNAQPLLITHNIS